MKPILIDGCQLAAQAAIEIVEDSVVAPHCSKLLTAGRLCRRSRDDGRGANAAMLHMDGTSYRRINRARREGGCGGMGKGEAALGQDANCLQRTQRGGIHLAS